MPEHKIAIRCILIISVAILYYLVKLDRKTTQCTEQLTILSENVAKNEKKTIEIQGTIDASLSLNDFRYAINQIKSLIPSSATNPKYDISHLKQNTQYVFGPIQDDEALCLYGLVKAIRPKTIVEFGFAHGNSSFNFLKAIGENSTLYSYDIILHNPNAAAFKDPRFKFHHKSQTEFSPLDIDNQLIDIAYMDAGHTIEIQTIAFGKIIKQMSPVGVIVVHDTGLHIGEYVNGSCTCDFPKLCGIIHQKGERVFINWILQNYPEYQVINFHSFEIFRHGLTFIQKKYNLSVEPMDTSNCKKTPF